MQSLQIKLMLTESMKKLRDSSVTHTYAIQSSPILVNIRRNCNVYGFQAYIWNLTILNFQRQVYQHIPNYTLDSLCSGNEENILSDSVEWENRSVNH